MCSIVGYIGKNFSSAFVFEGLARLEYRGYDSAGFACLESSSQRLMCVKASGQLSNLMHRIQKNPINGFVGIGHTRWSTHGDFSEKNAHPHLDCTKTRAVVHNGIIENHYELRKKLEESGHTFESLTDTEVVAHLLEGFQCPIQAIRDLVSVVKGMYALVIMIQDFPEMLIVVRKQSPLCVGFGDNEMFVASDVVAFANNAHSVFFLPDASFAFIYKDRIDAYDFSGIPLAVQPQELSATFAQVDKAGYEHFMLKEICEQPLAIKNTVYSLSALGDSLWSQLGVKKESVADINRIVLIGCGTSWHAACIAQFFFEMIDALPTTVHLASEFRYMPFFPDNNALYIVISQSGETADTLEALRLINSYGLKTVALTNVITSTIVREACGFLLTHAGIEVSVASTKAFSTQLTVLYWLAQKFAAEKSCTIDTISVVEHNMINAGYILDSVIEKYKYYIQSEVAQRYASYDKAVFLGKHISYPFAMESALKLKEIAYVFAQAYSAGELKHGPLALIDDTVPVYIFSHNDPLIYQKILSSAHVVKARGGRVIVFTYEGQDELREMSETFFTVPKNVDPLLGPLVMTGLMQFLMYSIAQKRGCPIDKPRNLAKSVTVE